MRKSDIQRSYHCGSSGKPMVNVKHHFYWPDIRAKYATEGHEFSGDAAFIQWADAQWAKNYEEGAFDVAEECARDAGWEMAREHAMETFHESVRVYSEGRSGGWLVVDGLPHVDDWDAIRVTTWARFVKGVADIMECLDYDLMWYLYVNVYEPIGDIASEYARGAKLFAG